MKLTDNLNQLVSTYHQLLEQCRDALAPTANQRTRNELRAAIDQLLKAHQAKPQQVDSGGGGE